MTEWILTIYAYTIFNHHFPGNIDTGYIVLEREFVGSAFTDLAISGQTDSGFKTENLKVTISKYWWNMYKISIVLAGGFGIVWSLGKLCKDQLLIEILSMYN